MLGTQQKLEDINNGHVLYVLVLFIQEQNTDLVPPQNAQSLDPLVTSDAQEPKLLATIHLIHCWSGIARLRGAIEDFEYVLVRPIV